ncbi:acetylxylan esterase [soil metagenome]
MAQTDLPLEALREYMPEVAQPADFDDFWSRTLAESRAFGDRVTVSSASTPVTRFLIDDVTFAGFGGDPIRAWVTRTSDAASPTIVEYVGYGGGRGVAGEQLKWAAAGYTHVLMDSRGQGSQWGSGGDTPDPQGSAPSTPGFMTRGIEDPAGYYYRRLLTDAVRLLDQLGSLPGVDVDRVAVTGVSQGGGISLAAAALSPVVRAVMPDVPFLCHFRHSVQNTPAPPFTEIARYLAVHRGQDERAFATLSYFDGVNFARRITQPALFSVGLMDEIVLPSSVFAAYNHLAASDREIAVYGFNGHDGGGFHHWLRQAEWLGSRAL